MSQKRVTKLFWWYVVAGSSIVTWWQLWVFHVTAHFRSPPPFITWQCQHWGIRRKQTKEEGKYSPGQKKIVRFSTNMNRIDKKQNILRFTWAWRFLTLVVFDPRNSCLNLIIDSLSDLGIQTIDRLRQRSACPTTQLLLFTLFSEATNHKWVNAAIV